MNKKNNQKIEIDPDSILKKFEEECKKTATQFSEYLSDMNPNKIDMNKINSILIPSIKDKKVQVTIHSLAKDNHLFIDQDGQRQVRIEVKSKVPSLFENIRKSLHQDEYSITDQSGIITVTLEPITEERRIRLSKEIHEAKEKRKVSVNNMRTDIHSAIKKSSLSEDEQERLKKKIELFKTKTIDQLEQDCSKKERQILLKS